MRTYPLPEESLMRANKLVATTLALLLPTALLAQEDMPSESEGAEPRPVQVVNVPAPKTMLERLAAERGAIIVKTYTDVATITGEDGANLRVTAVQFARDEQKHYGLAMTVQRSGRFERVATAFVDEEEIDRLMAALETIGKMQSGQVAGTDFDTTYTTRGDLLVANVGNNGTRMLQVRSTQILAPSGDLRWATARFRLGRAPEIQQQLVAAKGMIERMKAPGAAAGGNENK